MQRLQCGLWRSAKQSVRCTTNYHAMSDEKRSSGRLKQIQGVLNDLNLQRKLSSIEEGVFAEGPLATLNRAPHESKRIM